MDGQFYVDTRQPHLGASWPTITMATTLKAVVPVAGLPVLGANYFGYVGKTVRTTIFGQITTGATPGNFGFYTMWGSGADNTGITLNGVTGATSSLTNQTNTSFIWQINHRVRALGASGSLISWGYFCIQGFGFVMSPASGIVSVTCDLTQNNVLSPQMQRSGSTAETATVVDYLFEALN